MKFNNISIKADLESSGDIENASCDVVMFLYH